MLFNARIPVFSVISMPIRPMSGVSRFDYPMLFTRMSLFIIMLFNARIPVLSVISMPISPMSGVSRFDYPMLFTRMSLFIILITALAKDSRIDLPTLKK
jgi:hypothetical protein